MRIPAGRAILILLLTPSFSWAQLSWQRMDSHFPGLPASVRVFRSLDPLNGRPSVVWYVEADLRDRSLRFDTDTTFRRRLTPSQFHAKNTEPLLVVNGTFFSFSENRNLNAVMKRGRLVSYNVMTVPGRGRDTLKFHGVTRSAIGIDRRRRTDVAWLHTDSAKRHPVALEASPLGTLSDRPAFDLESVPANALETSGMRKRWRMRTAIGGGPVLVYDGKARITNDEERMFMGRAVDDLHPRTAMGYTSDGRLLVMAVEGRRKGLAEGASLREMAEILISLGSKEALNLDGGGSSCMLVMGRETIKPSDKEGQRAVPAVFLIRRGR
jgi:hypothetical protein